MRVMSKASLKVSQTTMTSAEFLDFCPRGAYTTARTVKGTDRVFELKRHMDRLVTSSKPFMKGAVDEADIRRLAAIAMEDAMISSASILEEHDCKLTVLITMNDTTSTSTSDTAVRDLEAFAHIEPMVKKDRSKPVYVALGGPPRINAIVKDSKWVHDRKSIVDNTAEDTLLLGDGGNTILEGSQTNFFAVLHSGTVLTAKDGILEGTVRAVVIDACADLKIPLSFDAPKVDEIEQYHEAFLASTSRLVLPIDIIGSHHLPKERPISDKIAEWVRKHVEERSVSVKSLLHAQS